MDQSDEGVKRAFKYRFYPTTAQATQLRRTLGCVRLVYNMALAERAEAWSKRSEGVLRADVGDAHGLEEDSGGGTRTG